MKLRPVVPALVLVLVLMLVLVLQLAYHLKEAEAEKLPSDQTILEHPEELVGLAQYVKMTQTPQPSQTLLEDVPSSAAASS